MRLGSEESPLMRCKRVLADISPISFCGIEIVVSGGLRYLESSISEMPIIDISSGMDILSECKADIAAIAMWSLLTNKAVGRFAHFMSSTVLSKHIPLCHSLSRIQAGSISRL